MRVRVCRATFALTAAAGALAAALAACCLPETRRASDASTGEPQLLPFADGDFESESPLAGARALPQDNGLPVEHGQQDGEATR